MTAEIESLIRELSQAVGLGGRDRSQRSIRRQPDHDLAVRIQNSAIPWRISADLQVVAWDGDDYQRRFDSLAARGQDVHGEATFVMALAPSTVLDAGCGTGRVAIELAHRGVDVVGVDADDSMLATARRLAPEVEWILADLASLELARRFDVVVMAGNVPLFTPPGTHAALVAGCARHVTDGGSLVCGFQLGRGYALEDYDAHAADAGLRLVERFATWDRDPFTEASGYAVSIHRA